MQERKIKSFTDGDITLHFIIMDIMESAKESLSIHEITKRVDQYLSVFESPKVFDESTIRKKLREYVNEGIIETEKCGKTLYYKKSDEIRLNCWLYAIKYCLPLCTLMKICNGITFIFVLLPVLF